MSTLWLVYVLESFIDGSSSTICHPTIGSKATDCKKFRIFSGDVLLWEIIRQVGGKEGMI